MRLTLYSLQQGSLTKDELAGRGGKIGAETAPPAPPPPTSVAKQPADAFTRN